MRLEYMLCVRDTKNNFQFYLFVLRENFPTTFINF